MKTRIYYFSKFHSSRVTRDPDAIPTSRHERNRGIYQGNDIPLMKTRLTIQSNTLTVFSMIAYKNDFSLLTLHRRKCTHGSLSVMVYMLPVQEGMISWFGYNLFLRQLTMIAASWTDSRLQAMRFSEVTATMIAKNGSDMMVELPVYP